MKYPKDNFIRDPGIILNFPEGALLYYMGIQECLKSDAEQTASMHAPTILQKEKLQKSATAARKSCERLMFFAGALGDWRAFEMINNNFKSGNDNNQNKRGYR